ncbi:MAG: uracil-DNA glycosylase family protein [Alphaproteobacteria bacterium]|nr:uracil-DNA glycosylase family protein [Alphaproteobacteria bacterium]
MTAAFDALLRKVRACDLCKAHLPFAPKPVLRASVTARILIIGQAPGTRVHESGIPWNDASGDKLREWLDLDRDTFYDESRIAIVPMGFCYPGKGAGGDLPPRPECAPKWHDVLLQKMPKIELTLLFGRYAHTRYLGDGARPTVTEAVRAWREFAPHAYPLPHPSPRNRRWLRNNPWFEKEVVPVVRAGVHALL